MIYLHKLKVTKCRAHQLFVFNWVIRSNDHVKRCIRGMGDM